MDFYTHGLDAIGRDWASASIKCALLLSNVFTDSEDFLAGVISDNGRPTVSYPGDQTATGQLRTVNTGPKTITYDLDPFDFTGMTAGETIYAFVLYLFITNDAASVPIGFEEIPGGIASDLFTTVTIPTILDTLTQAP